LDPVGTPWGTRGTGGGPGPSSLRFQGRRRRGRGEVYEPGRRETGGGRATQRPSGASPGGDPAARPTPNARPQLALRCTWRNGEHTIAVHTNGASERSIEAAVKWPRRRSTPRGWPCRTPNAQRPRDPSAQRPTPNAQRPRDPNAQETPTPKRPQRPRDPNAQETPTPNAKVVNPFGWSTAQLCRCYGLPQTPFVDPQDARPRRRHP
jgi:hypothetical protein